MSWMRRLFGLDSAERKLDAELRHHLELQVKDLMATGLSRQEAERRATLEFGGLDQVKEACRDERSTILWESWWQDIRFALRRLRRTPAFTLTALLTIAIGIGACTALFSLVNGVLFRPIQLPNADRIVTVQETRTSGGGYSVSPVSPGEFTDWRAQVTAFEHIALLNGRGYILTGKDGASRIGGMRASANYFQLLGVPMLLGRTFLPSEETPGADEVVILSHGFWQNRMGGRADVLNEKLVLDGKPYTIVGVLPAENLIWNAAVFMPLAFSAKEKADYGDHNFRCLGLLKPGVTLEQGRADMDAAAAAVSAAHPDSHTDRGVQVLSLLELLTGRFRQQLFVLLGAVGVLLLIACVNVASLLLASANARQAEFTTRAALGASRGRIVRQFLCESVLLSTAGGVLGLLLAAGCMGMLLRFAGRYLPRMNEVSLDARVLGVSFGLMLVTGIAFGLYPALQSSRAGLGNRLKEAGRGGSLGSRRNRVRTALVVAEIALALMLLASTGLLARTLHAMRHADQGFDPTDVSFAFVPLSPPAYNTGEKVAAFTQRALERLDGLPGLEVAAFANGVPAMGARGVLFHVVGSPPPANHAMPQLTAYSVTPDYFRLMRIPLRAGRGLTPRDIAGAPRVVVINETLARRFFPNTDPLGQRLNIYTMSDEPDVEREIVGVVADVKPGGPQSEASSQIYEPLAQNPVGSVILLVRGTEASKAAANEAFKSLDASLPTEPLRPYYLQIAGTWFRQQFSLILISLFAGIALVLAGIGIYGVMAYSVSQRRHEIGVRLALGAAPKNIFRLVVGEGAKMLVLGLVLGTAGSMLSSRLLRSLLYGTSPYDPVTFIAVMVILAAIALLACWLPARRAVKIDPIAALRAE